MKYTLHLTMTPFVGQQLESADAKNLLSSLVEFTKDVEFGYVNAANRAATLIVDTDVPGDLITKVVPWCIVTGEHPNVEPIVTWDEFIQSLADISGVSMAEIRGESNTQNTDEVGILCESGAPEGCCKTAKTIEELQPFKMPEGGEDLLEFVALDTIEVPGIGEETIELVGSYLIEREHPSSSDWNDAAIKIRMKGLDVEGESATLGKIKVSTNPEYKTSEGNVTSGTAFPVVNTGAPKYCEMHNYAKFELPDLGLTAFNKEPIELKHTITHVPPVGQGGGTGEIRIPLYNVKDPDGEPVAFLKKVKTHIGNFLKKKETEQDHSEEHKH